MKAKKMYALKRYTHKTNHRLFKKLFYHTIFNVIFDKSLIFTSSDREKILRGSIDGKQIKKNDTN